MISVVIPVYNRPRAVELAARSALSQQIEDGQEIEIVLVDDGSTPLLEVGDLARSRVVRVERNGGPAAARNLGVAASTGEFVAFLDSDDVWLPGKLAAQLALFRRLQNGSDLALLGIVLGFYYPNRRTGRLEARMPMPGRSASDFASGCWTAPGTTLLLHRSAFERVGPFDESLRRLEDYDWLLRFGLKGGRLEVANHMGAVIAPSGLALQQVVTENAARLTLKYGSAGKYALPSAVSRNFDAYLALERSVAELSNGNWRPGVIHLLQSGSLKPRLRGALLPFWSRSRQIPDEVARRYRELAENAMTSRRGPGRAIGPAEKSTAPLKCRETVPAGPAVLPRPMSVTPARVMFLYWGRRGLTQFALELGRTAVADPNIAASISVSRQNEEFQAFSEFGSKLFAIDTFETNVGAVTQAWRLPLLRQQLAARLRQDRTQAVIELIPHVWSCAVGPVIRANGARHVLVVHDADSHPGDHRSRAVKYVLDRAVREADLVLTLSEAVAGRLIATRRTSRDRLYTLFHPDLGYGPVTPLGPPGPGVPIRLLFMGRIMSYKALPLFLDVVDLLRAEGIAVEVGVFGEGKLGGCAKRLQAMGAEVVNRWLTAAEIAEILPRFHAMVLSHTEASQSGMAAVALGAGMPVIAAPTGGIIEQIKHGQNGLLALSADAPALAEAVKTLLLDPVLYRAICQTIIQTKRARSMADFAEQCVSHALWAGR